MTNSLIAVALNLIGLLVIYSLMANAITRFYWHGRGIMGVLGTIIVAGLFWILPAFLANLRDLHFPPYPLWFGDWLISGVSVVILCQSGRWIPRQLEDSARLDGCGWFGIYRYAVLPLVKRELGLIALLIVMATSPVFWPALTSPLGFAPPWLSLLAQIGIGNDPGFTGTLLIIVGGSVVMTLPVMVIFVLSKRWFPRPAKLENE